MSITLPLLQPIRLTLESRLLSKIRHPHSPQKPDVDRYFDDPLAQISEEATNDANWLFNWWKNHKDKYPCMAAAARDYLVIPASKIPCERVFSVGRDMIGLQRVSLHSSTIRQLSLLRASICNHYTH
jgi:hypothetical protein